MKQPEASIAIQVLPKTSTGEEVICIMDKVIAYLKGTGLNIFVGPFETTVEGSFDQLWEIAKECQLICIREGASAVSAYIKVAYNPSEGVWTIDKKLPSIISFGDVKIWLRKLHNSLTAVFRSPSTLIGKVVSPSC